ncbi:MAG: nucleoside hydrolase [Promethearchaeota archaeon]
MERILIDTDPGLGRKSSDVDDGLALFLILNNPEKFKVEGITSVYGNTRLKTGFKLLKEYLELTDNLDIPHEMGAKSNEELGKITKATDLLIKTVSENPNEITLFTFGPLTNIATVLQHYPEFFDDLKEIVFMGGNLEPHTLVHIRDPLSKTEFNFHADGEAAKLFIETPTKTEKIGMGLDICMKLFFEKRHLIKLKSADNPITNYIYEDVKYWFELWERKNNRGFHPFDVFVPMYKIKPELFQVNEYFIKVDDSNIPGRLFYSEKPKRNYTKVKYGIDFAQEGNKEDFMERFLNDLIER